MTSRNEVPAPDADHDNGESEFLHSETTRVIIGAFYALHNELGFGFLEAVYSNGLAVLLRNAGYRVEREVEFNIEFHGEIIGRYRADLIVDEKVIVEVKCARARPDALRAAAQLSARVGASGRARVEFWKLGRDQASCVNAGAAAGQGFTYRLRCGVAAAP